jgi:hypothetical protein
VTEMSAAQAEDSVRRTIILYNFLLDDRNFSGLAAVLHEQCSMVVGDFRVTGRDNMVAAVSAVQSAEPGRHLLGPSLIRIETPDRASAWTDMIGLVPGPDSTTVVAGTWRYHDRLVHEGGRWLFTHRFLHGPAEALLDGAPPLPVL